MDSDLNTNRDLRVPLVSPAPTDDGVLEGHFQPRGKSSFLTAMLRTLSASSKALMYYGPGSLPHRILEATAMELSRLSFDVKRLAVRAVREAGYRAFQDDELFPARLRATYASGAVLVSPPIRPFAQDVLIRAGDILSTENGVTAVVLEDAVLPAGEMTTTIHVRSEIPGASGMIPAGLLNQHLTNSAIRVVNPGPIDGGRDEESDSAIHQRFQDYILGIQTSSGRSILSAARQANTQGLSVKQAVLIRPWRIPWMNREMGYGYVVIDAGSGGAPNLLVQDAQRRMNLVAAAGDEVVALPCNPYAISLSIEAECRTDANLGAVEAGLQAAYRKAFADTQIEDGSGQGAVKLLDAKMLLDAVAGVTTVNFGDATPLLSVPIGTRAVAGVLTVTLRRGL